jgi:hypothetical protein
VFPVALQAGTAIVLDSASPLYTYLNGQGALRPYQHGTDDVSHAAISNLPLSERQLLIGDPSPGASRSRRRQARGPPARLAGLQVANWPGAEARRVTCASLRRAWPAGPLLPSLDPGGDIDGVGGLPLRGFLLPALVRTVPVAGRRFPAV